MDCPCPSTINGLKYHLWTKVRNATFDIMTEIKSSLPFSCPECEILTRESRQREDTIFSSAQGRVRIPGLWLVQPHNTGFSLVERLCPSDHSLASLPWSSCGRSHYIAAPMTHYKEGVRIKMYLAFRRDDEDRHITTKKNHQRPCLIIYRYKV